MASVKQTVEIKAQQSFLKLQEKLNEKLESLKEESTGHRQPRFVTNAGNLVQPDTMARRLGDVANQTAEQWKVIKGVVRSMQLTNRLFDSLLNKGVKFGVEGGEESSDKSSNKPSASLVRQLMAIFETGVGASVRGAYRGNASNVPSVTAAAQGATDKAGALSRLLGGTAGRVAGGAATVLQGITAALKTFRVAYDVSTLPAKVGGENPEDFMTLAKRGALVRSIGNDGIRPWVVGAIEAITTMGTNLAGGVGAPRATRPYDFLRAGGAGVFLRRNLWNNPATGRAEHLGLESDESIGGVSGRGLVPEIYGRTGDKRRRQGSDGALSFLGSEGLPDFRRGADPTEVIQGFLRTQGMASLVEGDEESLQERHDRLLEDLRAREQGSR